MKKINSIFYILMLLQIYQVAGMFNAGISSGVVSVQYTPTKRRVDEIENDLYQTTHDHGSRKCRRITSELYDINSRIANAIGQPLTPLLEHRRRISLGLNEATDEKKEMVLAEESLAKARDFLLPILKNHRGLPFIDPAIFPTVEQAMLEEGYRQMPDSSYRDMTVAEKAYYARWKQQKQIFQARKKEQEEAKLRQITSGCVVFRPVSGAISDEVVTIARLEDLF